MALSYKATVTVNGHARASYKGDLGTVRRKGLRKLQQLVGREVMRPWHFLGEGRLLMNWGDSYRVEDLSGETPWRDHLSSVITMA